MWRPPMGCMVLALSVKVKQGSGARRRVHRDMVYWSTGADAVRRTRFCPAYTGEQDPPI